MTKTAHIVCAGPAGSAGVKDLTFALGKDDFLIAADGGYAACMEAGLIPQLAVGDFDSLPGGKPVQLPCPCVELPCKKDDTDLMVCLQQALQRGYRNVRIHRALGGDLGHTIAAIKCLAWLREQGARGVLFGCGQGAVIAMPEDRELDLSTAAPVEVLDGMGNLAAETRVSVFAFGGDAHGVAECGLEWELDGATLLASDHLGVSNATKSPRPTVSVGEGRLLVVIGG